MVMQVRNKQIIPNPEIKEPFKIMTMTEQNKSEIDMPERSKAYRTLNERNKPGNTMSERNKPNITMHERKTNK